MRLPSRSLSHTELMARLATETNRYIVEFDNTANLQAAGLKKRTVDNTVRDNNGQADSRSTNACMPICALAVSRSPSFRNTMPTSSLAHPSPSTRTR